MLATASNDNLPIVPLLPQFDQNTFDRHKTYTGIQLEQVVLQELSKKWIPLTADDRMINTDDQIPDIYMPSVNGMLNWALVRFDLTTDATIPDLDAAVLTQISIIKNIAVKVKEARERNDDFKDGEIKDMLIRIAHIVRECRNSVSSTVLLSSTLDTNQYENSNLSNPETIVDNILSQDTDKLTTFQQLLSFVQRRLETARYRKLEDSCYNEIIIENEDGTHYATHAWEKVSSIKEFFQRNVQKEIDYTQWKNSTNPHDNGKRVISYLTEENKMVEFPLLAVDRYLWSLCKPW